MCITKNATFSSLFKSCEIFYIRVKFTKTFFVGNDFPKSNNLGIIICITSISFFLPFMSTSHEEIFSSVSYKRHYYTFRKIVSI